jgi:hypothetical protein
METPSILKIMVKSKMVTLQVGSGVGLIVGAMVGDGVGGTSHTLLPLHCMLPLQSPVRSHCLPASQPGQKGPPQSTSVSPQSRPPLLHVATVGAGVVGRGVGAGEGEGVGFLVGLDVGDWVGE